MQHLAVGTSQPQQLLDGDDLRVMVAVEQRTRAALRLLGRDRQVFGIIHGDLMQANYLVHPEGVRVIDFADFGWGHFLYDMGITLFAPWGLDDDQSQRAAFLAGYREVRPLHPDHEALLDRFIAARAVVQARFVMGSRHAADRQIARPYVRRVLDRLKSLTH